MQSDEQVAKLWVSRQGEPETEVALGDRLTIGRSATNQLVLDDPKVSRHHAEIRHVGGDRYRLQDLASANGTWLNGRRVAAPKELADGDQVQIGSAQLRFATPHVTHIPELTASPGTVPFIQNELVVVLVSDIRNFTTMTEALPKDEFSRFIAAWFRDCSEVIEKRGGTIDKFIGDAILIYWVAATRADPAPQVNAALETARDLIARAEDFSVRLAMQFPGYSFRIGIGLNMGEAMRGNVGTGDNQSFTIVGDSVDVAFRLEALTKEKASAVLTSRSIADHASSQFRFRDLGTAQVKGRKEPVPICALELQPETEV